MLEGFRATPDQYFIPKEPSPRVKRFLQENPDPSWQKRVNFLLLHFPQKDRRSIEWVPEGGFAVSQYCPEQGRRIKDIDIITRSQAMANEFKGKVEIPSKPESESVELYFHTRWVNDWLRERKWEVSTDNINYLFYSSIPLPVEGQELLFIAPLHLIASKTCLYGPKHPRTQDELDNKMMGADDPKIQAKVRGVIQRFQGVPLKQRLVA